jgi:hypothetical protein
MTQAPAFPLDLYQGPGIPLSRREAMVRRVLTAQGGTGKLTQARIAREVARLRAEELDWGYIRHGRPAVVRCTLDRTRDYFKQLDGAAVRVLEPATDTDLPNAAQHIVTVHLARPYVEDWPLGGRTVPVPGRRTRRRPSEGFGGVPIWYQLALAGYDAIVLKHGDDREPRRVLAVVPASPKARLASGIVPARIDITAPGPMPGDRVAPGVLCAEYRHQGRRAAVAYRYAARPFAAPGTDVVEPLCEACYARRPAGASR